SSSSIFPMLSQKTYSNPVLRRSLLPPLCPYTTLFRSLGVALDLFADTANRHPGRRVRKRLGDRHDGATRERLRLVAFDTQLVQRSEEHTSELQSRENLVCRLLLEKKNTKQTYDTTHHV